ncbi:MAG: hypothetical protein KGJ66_11715 [Alphaproteobacteria bacterium]|nr:hypothetical protein [Alphaproteobacteria bacterium]
MTQVAQLELEGWQALLDRNADMFRGMAAGARIGLLSKDDFEPPTATMVVWQADGERMRAAYESFPGFDRVNIDLLFVADDDTIRHLHDPDAPAPFAEIKRKVRRREVLLYVVKPRDELLEWGYEDFLDSLGLAFMGACR